MNKAEKMIDELKALGIQLSRNGENLHWEGPNVVMTPARSLQLKELKPEIMRLLGGKQDSPETKHPVPNRLTRGNCLGAMKRMDDNSVDQIVTDPPYGLKFMGKSWDKEVPSLSIWQECYRVLKPGGFAFIMCPSRQDLMNKMIANLEQAGFCTNFTPLYWTYASGFPKAHNISKAVDKKMKSQSGAASDTAPVSPEAQKFEGAFGGFRPKPAVEVILVVMKPLDQKSYADQAMANGKGMTWLGDCSIPYSADDKTSSKRTTNKDREQISETDDKSGEKSKANQRGRFPANLIVSEDVLGDHSKYFSLDSWAERWLKNLPKPIIENLPFLIIPKPSMKEKESDLDDFEEQGIGGRDEGQDERDNPYKIRPKKRKNIHPTVKPIKLMMYLIIMGSRAGDLVLDPFMGSGTTAKAALAVNRRIVGIEIEDEYFDIAKTKYKTSFIAKYYSPGNGSQETTVNEEPAAKDTNAKAQGRTQE